MKLNIDTEQFRIDLQPDFSLASQPTKVAPLYQKKKEYNELLDAYSNEIRDLQAMMYAQDKYSLLLIFQGMDTAGKDGAIKHVMSGINPAGFMISSFKKPSDNELDHDWMWRTTCKLPQRGRIGIFNRSYYEEVLVVKVHPKILTDYQRIPAEFIQDLDGVFQERYEDIRNFEKFLHRNGTKVVKFFIHISKEEQRQRFLKRIDVPEKNWKMTTADIKERGFWDDYQKTYAEALGATSTPDSPWYAIPGDDKKNARLIISQVVLNQLESLHLKYPEASDEHRAELQEIRKQLEKEAP